MRPASPVSFLQRSLYTRLAIAICIFTLFFIFIKICFFPSPNFDETVVIVVTPTHKRLERLADLTRMAQTLRHINNLHWIVIEDGEETVDAVERILWRSGLYFVYLSATTPKGMPAKGWTHRNLALQHIRENYEGERKAVIFFGDDDNSYDVRLFDNYIRKVQRIGVWAVGLSGGAFVEAPRVEDGEVTGWDVMYARNRTFATDMAGFAVNIKELIRVATANFNEECKKPYHFGPEPCFLSQFGLRWDELEPFGYNDYPRDILVWHTKTTATRVKGSGHGYVIEDPKKH